VDPTVKRRLKVFTGMHYPETEHATWDEVLKAYNFPGGKLWDGEKMIEDKWDGKIIPY
jgi:hypothetical protein